MSNSDIQGFLWRMAQFTTPEDELAELTEIDRAEYEDAADYVSDFSCDRLFEEYGTFMEMVREARRILKGYGHNV